VQSVGTERIISAGGAETQLDLPIMRKMIDVSLDQDFERKPNRYGGGCSPCGPIFVREKYLSRAILNRQLGGSSCGRAIGLIRAFSVLL
jgi:hypothetical protein